MANAPIVITDGDEDIEYEYDSDGNPIVPDRAKVDTWIHIIIIHDIHVIVQMKSQQVLMVVLACTQGILVYCVCYFIS